MIIAFIGCDGSGKSTISKKLISHLKRREKNVNYRHQYNYFISNKLGNAIRKAAKDKKSRDAKRSSIFHKIWVFLVYPNLIYNWTIQKIFRRDQIIISDRYVYDLMIGWELQGRLNAVSRLLYRSFPKPDYIFLVDAPSKVLLERKPDEYPNFKFCKKKRELYLEFAKNRDIKIINTDQPISSSFKQVIESLEEV